MSSASSPRLCPLNDPGARSNHAGKADIAFCLRFNHLIVSARFVGLGQHQITIAAPPPSALALALALALGGLMALKLVAASTALSSGGNGRRRGAVPLPGPESKIPKRARSASQASTYECWVGRNFVDNHNATLFLKEPSAQRPLRGSRARPPIWAPRAQMVSYRRELRAGARRGASGPSHATRRRPRRPSDARTARSQAAGRAHCIIYRWLS
jgi:hypothetical protein